MVCPDAVETDYLTYADSTAFDELLCERWMRGQLGDVRELLSSYCRHMRESADLEIGLLSSKSPVEL